MAKITLKDNCHCNKYFDDTSWNDYCRDLEFQSAFIQWTWQYISHILTSILILMSSEPITCFEPVKLLAQHMQFHRQLCQISG